MLVENIYPVEFKYAEFSILLNPFTADPGHWQTCVGYIYAKSASSPERDEVTTDFMLAIMKNSTFDFYHNSSCVLTICYPETLTDL